MFRDSQSVYTMPLSIHGQLYVMFRSTEQGMKTNLKLNCWEALMLSVPHWTTVRLVNWIFWDQVVTHHHHTSHAALLMRYEQNCFFFQISEVQLQCRHNSTFVYVSILGIAMYRVRLFDSPVVWYDKIGTSWRSKSITTDCHFHCK